MTPSPYALDQWTDHDSWLDAIRRAGRLERIFVLGFQSQRDESNPSDRRERPRIEAYRDATLLP